MSDAVSMFWSIGSSYFSFLSSNAFVGIPILCYILGVAIVGILLSNLLSLARSTHVGLNTSKSNSYRQVDYSTNSKKGG